MPSPDWTPENNLTVKRPPLPLPEGVSFLQAVMAANEGLTAAQEQWENGSAFKLLDNGSWEVKMFILDPSTGKRGITRHFTIYDPSQVAIAIPYLVAAETGIGLEEIIAAQKDKSKDKTPGTPGRTPR